MYLTFLGNIYKQKSLGTLTSSKANEQGFLLSFKTKRMLSKNKSIYLVKTRQNVFMACKNTNYTLYYIERTYFNCIKSLIDDSFTFN